MSCYLRYFLVCIVALLWLPAAAQDDGDAQPATEQEEGGRRGGLFGLFGKKGRDSTAVASSQLSDEPEPPDPNKGLWRKPGRWKMFQPDATRATVTPDTVDGSLVYPPGYDPADTLESEYVGRSPFRIFINKFSWDVMMGYGQTYYRANIPEGTLYGDGVLNTSLQYLNGPVAATTTVPGDAYTNQDFPLGFRGGLGAVPLFTTLRFNLLKKIRLGAGLGFEYQNLGSLEALGDLEGRVAEYDFGSAMELRWRYFGYVGYQYYTWGWYQYAVDAYVGKAPYLLGNVQGQSSFFVNVGFPIEHVASRYLRFTLRPSYEWKRYTVAGQRVRESAVYATLGFSFTFPDMPRAKHPADEAQVLHFEVHPRSGKKRPVRGQPVWHRQDPKTGELRKHRTPPRKKWWRSGNGVPERKERDWRLFFNLKNI